MPAPRTSPIEEVLEYNPDTGIIIWKHTNKEAGGPLGDYIGVTYNNKYYSSHRLAWYLYYGVWPTLEVDHINGDKKDNRITNLREIPHYQNQQNRRNPNSNSLTRLLGVTKDGSNYRARITIIGKTISLGHYKTKEEAFAAYLTAKRELHEGCTI